MQASAARNFLGVLVPFWLCRSGGDGVGWWRVGSFEVGVVVSFRVFAMRVGDGVIFVSGFRGAGHHRRATVCNEVPVDNGGGEPSSFGWRSRCLGASLVFKVPRKPCRRGR
jgi:hypothetical protein